MKIIIIGGGIAGQTAADTIRKQDPEASITIITKEVYGYYSRIFLPAYLVGEKPLDKLILRKPDWYNERDIGLLLGTKVEHIDPKAHTITIKGESSPLSYDKLILATGANPRRLPFGNPEVEGMFTLRNVADADSIRKFIEVEQVKKALIIGGGLLGIELASYLSKMDVDITVCEIAPYLLPRQLDKASSEILTKYLADQGLMVVCGVAVEKVLGDSKVTGVRLKNGKEMPFQLILQQMGVIPEITLAKESGLETGRGIIVNEFMQTNDPDIYAAGDCVQFNDRVWGIIPASMEQSKLAANHILGLQPEPYRGTFWYTRLKVAGIKLCCLGQPPNAPENEGSGAEILVESDAAIFQSRRIILENNKLKGAVLMGEGSDRYFMKNLDQEVNRDEIKKELKKCK